MVMTAPGRVGSVHAAYSSGGTMHNLPRLDLELLLHADRSRQCWPHNEKQWTHATYPMPIGTPWRAPFSGFSATFPAAGTTTPPNSPRSRPNHENELFRCFLVATPQMTTAHSTERPTLAYTIACEILESIPSALDCL
jgi:hypothetical protein